MKVSNSISLHEDICSYGYHRKRELAGDLGIVVISLLDLRLSGSEMRAHETDTCGVEEHTNSHTPFVPSGSTHASLNSVYSNIPDEKDKLDIILVIISSFLYPLYKQIIQHT